MEHFELVEKLVNTFGVSYEDAKTALEKSGWDPVEAAVILERGKNGTPETETPKVNTNVKGSTSCRGENLKQDGRRVFKSIWEFLSLNEFIVKKASGETFLDIPLWLAILLLCSFFWAIIFILVIVFLMGYRFSFAGPHLGKKSVNDAVNRAETIGKDFVDRVKNSCAPAEDKTVNPETFTAETVREEVKTETAETPAAEVPSEPTDNTEPTE